MKLVDYWHKYSDRGWKRIPAVLQGILVIWVLIGILVAIVPELQRMPDVARLAIGFPAALAMLWMIVGLFLSIADKLISAGSFILHRIGGAR